MTQKEIERTRQILGERFKELSDEEIKMIHQSFKAFIVRVIDTHIPHKTL